VKTVALEIHRRAAASLAIVTIREILSLESGSTAAVEVKCLRSNKKVRAASTCQWAQTPQISISAKIDAIRTYNYNM
jgi:hypothetical protein